MHCGGVRRYMGHLLGRHFQEEFYIGCVDLLFGFFFGNFFGVGAK